jgi:hypothetical protein
MTATTNGHQTATRGRRLYGARELMLIQDLAVGDHTYSELAERYDVAEQSINNFANRNRQRIADAARGQVEALANLWITRKEMRIATYQAEADRNLLLIDNIEAAVADISESVGVPVSPDTDKITRLQTNVFRALASAAEETGQLPTRSPAENRPRLRHVIEGLDGWEGAT